MVQFSLSFTCSSLTNETICNAYNCTFSNGLCMGTLTPSCNFHIDMLNSLEFLGTGNCFYVEANAPITPGVGTLASPFINISLAFSKINSIQTLNGVYRIIILPKNEIDELYLTGSFLYNQIKVYIS